MRLRKIVDCKSCKSAGKEESRQIHNNYTILRLKPTWGIYHAPHACMPRLSHMIPFCDHYHRNMYIPTLTADRLRAPLRLVESENARIEMERSTYLKPDDLGSRFDSRQLIAPDLCCIVDHPCSSACVWLAFGGLVICVNTYGPHSHSYINLVVGHLAILYPSDLLRARQRNNNFHTVDHSTCPRDQRPSTGKCSHQGE
jgi:hypothetical protein